MTEFVPWDREDLHFQLDDPADLARYREDGVSHVCHLEDAIRIAEDGYIRPFPVEDESILRDTRVSVCWLSTKEWWSDEYRYGNIRFHFEWGALVEWSSLYWVEVMDYAHRAYRILLWLGEDDELELDAIGGDPVRLSRYPHRENQAGPVWFDPDAGVWYCNDTRCSSEFMYPGRLLLDHCLSIDFVDHTPRELGCGKQGNCRHYGAMGGDVGARFIAVLAGRGMSETGRKISLDCPAVRGALHSIRRNLGHGDAVAPDWPPTEADLALAKAMLTLWGYERDDDAEHVGSSLGDPEARVLALTFALAEGLTCPAETIAEIIAHRRRR